MNCRRLLLAALLGTLGLMPGAAMACYTITFEDYVPISQLRAESKPVATDASCRMKDGGLRDSLSLGPAEDIGNGRFFQTINNQDWHVLLGDCATGDLTVLKGRATPALLIQSCEQPKDRHDDLVGERAAFALSEGNDLNALRAVASNHGATAADPEEVFFQTRMRDLATGEFVSHQVGPRDRFDLLCGCKALYPESKGANL
ncbi:MAG: hypothetical protein AAFX00_11090 [Pseudomonadota bacterium]